MRRNPNAACHRLSVVGAVGLCIVACSVPAAAGKRAVKVCVESNPPGALVSVALSGDAAGGGAMTVAGETPLTKTFRFPKKHNLRLRFEKAGFEPLSVEISLDTSKVSVDLVRLGGGISPSAPVTVLALVTPQLKVVKRGFAKEREDAAANVAVGAVVARAMVDRLEGRVEVIEVRAGDFGDLLRPLWRDIRSSMELVDPIRLPYLPVLPTLESRAARTAVLELAARTGADAVLFVAGKANIETGGMKAGTIGMMAVGTASSFASGYSNAMAGGSDFFTYNIYLPSFAEGLALKALLVDGRSSTIRWANKGLWKPIPLDKPEVVHTVVADLLSGLENNLSTGQAGEIHEEE